MYTLGVELSTQSVKLVVLDLNASAVHYSGSFHYDTTFPEYGTDGGVLPSDIPDVRNTSPRMLVQAIDFAFQKLTDDGVDLRKLQAVKCDCMQHCTIYTNNLFARAVKRLIPGKNLVDQIGRCLSRTTVPIWEDRSPREEVRYLTDFLSSCGGMHYLTGNRAELRFPAAQILKWARHFPEEYRHTSNIFVLSAFITSVLAGRIAAVDTGDGWGTNLNHLDIEAPGWSRPVIAAADAYLQRAGLSTSLAEKIGGMVPFDTVIGSINPYFAERFNVNPEALILAGTGDNPATLMGSGGNIVISLGTSYTVNGMMESIKPPENSDYNIFGYVDRRAMALSVITNGGKVHTYFRERSAIAGGHAAVEGVTWKSYSAAAGSLRLCREEKLMLPYLMDESVPVSKSGIVCDGFSENEKQAVIRALHLSQVLSLKLHSAHLGDVEKICIAGGGAKNRVMRQWIADAFNAQTYTTGIFEMAAPMGCAISCAANVLNISCPEASSRFLKIDENSICRPKSGQRYILNDLLDRYRKLEKRYF